MFNTIINSELPIYNSNSEPNKYTSELTIKPDILNYYIMGGGTYNFMKDVCKPKNISMKYNTDNGEIVFKSSSESDLEECINLFIESINLSENY